MARSGTQLSRHSAPAAARYEVTSLPFMPFSGTGGEALSNDGVAAGGMANSDGSVSLATWREGLITDLGPPPGLPTPDFNRPRVFGMNDSGTIVGTVHTAAGDLPSRWFIYERGQFMVLPLADPTDLGGAAIGVNECGEVVGYDHTSSNAVIGWLWSAGTYSRLPVKGKSTAALAINSSGTIIGNRSLSLIGRLLRGRPGDRGARGYILSQAATRHLKGFVYAINHHGDAVGGSARHGKAVATLFSGGFATVILEQPSTAVGINSFAQVVGSYQPAGCERRHLFIWSAQSGALDLTPDGYASAEAAAINDRGQVLAFGETLSGKSRYFLLTPDPNGAVRPRPPASGRPAAAG